MLRRRGRVGAVDVLGWRTGPMPDYAPLWGVATHAVLADMAPAIPATLSALLGPRHRVERFSGLGGADGHHDDARALVWLRDYQPTWLRDRGAQLIACRTLAVDRHRDAYLGPDIADRIPSTWASIIHEGGNLVRAGRRLLITDQLVEDNCRDWPHAPHLARGGYRPRSEWEVIRRMARAFGVQPFDIVVLPRLPFEATGHVDTWLLPLGPHDIAVPSIPAEALMLTQDASTRGVGASASVFLDTQADRLARLGYRVWRLPMLAPELVLDAAGEPTAIYLSPANALLLAGSWGRLALLPRFNGLPLGRRGHRLARAFERAWAETLQQRGWTSVFVECAGLFDYLGLLRCATCPLPARS